MHLRNLWYYALPGRALKRGRMRGLTLLGEPVLLARDADGQPFALRDICPHRGVPLRHGRFDGREVECCYHGWRFDREGRCTAIPALVPGQDLDPGRIRVRHYPCREVQGNIWVFMDDARPGTPEPPPPPEVPGLGERAPRLSKHMVFPVPMDHAVVGLMDPAHGPFVHTSWWWRSRRSIHEKAKRFGPSPLGFTMLRHAPSKNAGAYKLLGGAMATEIAFQLPGTRIEHVQAGRHVLCNLTAVTPIDDDSTMVNHCIYWTQPWLTALLPVGHYLASTFLAQDRDLVTKQREGLAFDPPLMMINDADVPAKWYYRLKKEWARVQAEGGTFVNPVREATLRWRS